MSAVLMRVNIAGYSGKAVSVYCAYDPGTEMLAVSRSTDYDGGDRAGFLKITNQDRDNAFDVLFSEEVLSEAITAYFELDALKLLAISPKIQGCNPDNGIERDGIDTSGMKYRISPSFTNSQMAVLAAARYAKVQRGVSTAADLMQDMRLLTI